MATSFQNLQQQMATKRQEYGQRVADLPKFQSSLKEAVYGKEKIAPALRSQKDASIMQLWDVDKRMAERYANPESEMFIRDPYKREEIAAGQHQATLGQVSGATRLLENREQHLEGILERGVKIFELGLGAKEKEMGFLDTEFRSQLALEEHKLKREEAARKSKGETSEADRIAALIKLLSGQGAVGQPPQYSPSEPDEVATTDGGQEWKYNTSTDQWDPLGDKPMQDMSPLLMSIYPELGKGIASEYLTRSLFPEESKEDKADREGKKMFEGVSSALDNYLLARSQTSPQERLDPRNPSGARVESQKNILTQILAKEVEKNRLSDEDRKFYLKQMPAWWMDNELAAQKIEGVKDGLMAKYSSAGESFSAVDPETGDAYEADTMEEYIELLNEGYMPM